MLQDWGEGSASGSGRGGPAEPGDATWLHTFYDTQTWAAPGGDFDPAVSASTPVDLPAFYQWQSAGMAADVQGWLDQPQANFGWMLLGSEGDLPSSKRFDSRESPIPSQRPVLQIDYLPSCAPADVNCDGVIDGRDISRFVDVMLGAVPCSWCAADVTADGTVDQADLSAFVQQLLSTT